MPEQFGSQSAADVAPAPSNRQREERARRGLRSVRLLDHEQYLMRNLKGGLLEY